MSDNNVSLNFAPSRRKQQPARVEAPRLRETVTVHAAPANEDRAGHLLKNAAEWGWSELQSYVASKIIELQGPFPRNDRKEYGIFNGFVSRYGKMAGPIAVYAFERADGMWMNAPIQVTRFCKGSDPYFGDKILTKLQQA